MKYVRRVLVLGVLLLVGWFIGKELVALDVDQFDLKLGFVALTLALWTLSSLLSLASFKYLLLQSDIRPPWQGLLTIAWLPPLGKYVPGKFLSVVGAVILLRYYGASGQTAMALALLRQVLSLCSGVVVGLPALLAYLGSMGLESFPQSVWFMLALVIMAVLIVAVQRVRRAKPMWLRIDWRFSLRHSAQCVTLMLASTLVLGSAAWMAAHSINGITVPEPLTMISGFPLAAIIGFLAIISPGGIGIREGALLLLLVPEIGAADAALLVVVLRMYQIIIDVALGVFGFIASHYWRQPESSRFRM